ncbi:MAG: SMP-30/gluconolactonase/LRE family protein [Cyclobacteriaceae bacterium]|nr:SMP-30/gluconolactonase/LRE family protein [Cyclobacteriaceae bacterium]
MKKIFITIIILLLFGIKVNLNAQEIVASGAQLEKLSGGFSFTEGPASDTDGNVFFTDQPNDRILQWSTDDILTTWMKPSGRSNGLSFDKEGNLWSCADENNQLWKIGPGKEVEVIVEGYNNKLLNGPNDLWITPAGGVYFSDPYYQRPWWDHKEMPQNCQCVYYLSPDGSKLNRVVDNLQQPNGIIGTPDGKILYVTDIKDNKTYSYTVRKDGSLTAAELFCEMGSDGMTIDDQGNLYLTNKGVFVFNKKGEQIKHIEVPESWTANVCFGGKDKQSLFITASKGLYRIRLNVKGVGSQ